MSSAATSSLGLTPAQLADFDRDGYLIIPDFFPQATATALKSHADELLESFDLSTHPRTIFRTAMDGAQTTPVMNQDSNRYFLDSADKISYFFEADAFNADGKLLYPKSRAINKIGHALHTLDKEFHAFTYDERIKALAKSLEFKKPIVLQSMVICKQPKIGGVVDPHRDSTFLHTDPSTATGLWFALEDCTADNGCLSFVPGSHKDGKNTKRFVRKETKEQPLRPSINNPDYDATSAASSQPAPNNEHIDLIFTGEDKGLPTYPPEAWKPAPVKQGTLVLIHGDVVHASTHNHSEKSRYIYTFHIIDSGETTKDKPVYETSNWLQSNQPFPVLNQ